MQVGLPVILITINTHVMNLYVVNRGRGPNVHYRGNVIVVSLFCNIGIEHSPRACKLIIMAKFAIVRDHAGLHHHA